MGWEGRGGGGGGGGGGGRKKGGGGGGGVSGLKTPKREIGETLIVAKAFPPPPRPNPLKKHQATISQYPPSSI